MITSSSTARRDCCCQATRLRSRRRRLRSRPRSQFTLGVFLAALLFSLDALIAIRSSAEQRVPAATKTITYLLVLATVVMFVVFLHGMVRLLRVQHLLRDTARSAHASIDQGFPPRETYLPVDTPHDGPRAPTAGSSCESPLANTSVSVASSRVSMGPRPISSPTPRSGRTCCAATSAPWCRTRVSGSASSSTSEAARSRPVNDPTTAAQAVQRVVDLLERVTDRPDPAGWYTDAAGTVRVRLVEPDFERLARLGFTEIALYGAGAPQITTSLAAAHEQLEAQCESDRAAVIARLRSELATAAGEAIPTAFAARALVPDHLGMG